MGQTLTLHANGTYVQRVIRGGWEMFEGSGVWHADATGAELILATNDGLPGYLYHIADRETLLAARRSDSTGAGCPTPLRRTARVIDFSGEMRPVTLYSDVWTLIALRGKMLDSPSSKPPRIRFDAATRRVKGSTGCDPIDGTFVQAGMHFMVHLRKQIRKSCNPPTDAIAGQLRDALGRTTSFFICCSVLRLRDGATTLAEFRTTR